MTTRRALIIVPVIVVLFLLQSYFWVPTYEEQTRGNPDRLKQYITATIGDASLLNPILTADSASSQIESMVFEGLIDRDDQLLYRGRVARDWQITEVAYFYINHARTHPTGGEADGKSILAWLQQQQSAGAPELKSVTAMDLLPAQVLRTTRQFTIDGTKQTVRITAKAPARIQLTLDQVDQDFFTRLQALLGKDYFATFDAAHRVTTEPVLPAEDHQALAREMLPATEHNPVIVFRLRPGIRFHDGHELDAEDVKFTYQAIVNPRNLSPRIPDYEPVKSVSVLDPLTVKITYKRLYSPALGTWGMGILPQHRLNDDALAAEARATGKDPATFTLRQSRFNREPIGSGPFVFKEWKSDRYIRLERFEQYWEGPPNYHTYIMRIIPDPLTQEMEFYAGTVDNYAVVPHQVERLRADDRFQQFSGTSFGYSYIASTCAVSRLTTHVSAGRWAWPSIPAKSFAM